MSNLPTHIFANNADKELVCKLTPASLKLRKATILAGLKVNLLEHKELKDGFAYRFPGSDEMIDQVNAFMKSERVCCSSLVYGMSVSGDATELWLFLTGPEGVKDFIKEELDL